MSTSSVYYSRPESSINDGTSFEINWNQPFRHFITKFYSPAQAWPDDVQLAFKALYAILRADFTSIWCTVEENVRIDEAVLWFIRRQFIWCTHLKQKISIYVFNHKDIKTNTVNPVTSISPPWYSKPQDYFIIRVVLESENILHTKQSGM